ncbi:MAG: hypothetical protein IKJ28_07475 [Alphaproteobacteria bacterium]|nr:hypothetical protein [Alphaproteobacteria bacterium]
MFETTTNSKKTGENNNWTEKMLLAAITDDFILYSECANNMDMSSYLQQPSSETALKLASIHGSPSIICALIGDACRENKNSNVDCTQGVCAFLKREVSQEDLLKVLEDNPIELKDQERLAKSVAQIFASEKFTKADEIALRCLVSRNHNDGFLSQLLPNALHAVVQNDFKLSPVPEKTEIEQIFSEVEKTLEDYKSPKVLPSKRPDQGIPEPQTLPEIMPDNPEQDMEKENTKQSPSRLSQIIKSSALFATAIQSVSDEAENNPSNCKCTSGRE